MTNELTNAERAARARQVVETYNDEWDADANLIDLLTDLQHYVHLAHASDAWQRTFDELLTIARGHFQAELSGEE